MERVTVEDARPGQRRRYWEDALNAIHPQTAAGLVDETRFHGSLSWRRMGDVLLSDIRSTAQYASRQSLHIRRDERDVVQLNVQLDGIGRLVQDGRNCITRPGEIVIYDSSRPYELYFPRPFRQLYVEFPRSLLRARFGPTENVTARTINGASGLGRFLYDYVSSLILQSEDADATAIPRLQNHLVDLLITAFSDLPDGTMTSTSFCRTMALCRAKTYISDNLRNDSLSPATVAQALGISRRYLYDLFADEGMAVGCSIRQARLERCRSDIENPALSGRSLSEIAFSWGFNEAGHFSRAFRNHFGITPRACRTAMRASMASRQAGAHTDKF